MPELPTSTLNRDEWTMAFATAWHDIAEGAADFEHLVNQGNEL
jgi:hypothetical protein